MTFKNARCKKRQFLKLMNSYPQRSGKFFEEINDSVKTRMILNDALDWAVNNQHVCAIFFFEEKIWKKCSISKILTMTNFLINLFVQNWQIR